MKYLEAIKTGAIVGIFIMTAIGTYKGGNTIIINTPPQIQTAEVEETEEITMAEQRVRDKNAPAAPEVIEEKEENTKESVDFPADFDTATKNAYKSAKNYLSFTSFSKKGLIQQLSAEYGDKYTLELATAAVQFLEDNGEVDWNEQAYKTAKNYLSFTSFSREGLINQLTAEYGDKYTLEQAEYAANKVGL